MIASSKPEDVFDRDREWPALASFLADPRPAATLGVVSGRSRQGKTYLLHALTDACGGVYFGATEATSEDALRMWGETLGAWSGAGAPLRFESWAAALHAIVGGTPAYRREFVRGDAPADSPTSTTG